MSNPLPEQEIRNRLKGKGFLRLHGQDAFIYISDAPRRITETEMERLQDALRERGYVTAIDSSALLLIDLAPERWEALVLSFQNAAAAPFPQNEELFGVYALARLLERHPAEPGRQPMDMIRGVFKQYARRGGLPALAPRYLERCAEKLRRGESLPSALAKVLYTWLNEKNNANPGH